jgi:Protein of unknown function (DUF2958)
MSVARFHADAFLVRGLCDRTKKASANTRNLSMSLFTQSQTEQLIANCQQQIVRMDNRQPDFDFKPVVKLFTPDAQCTWLVTELDPDDGLAFGLCDRARLPRIGLRLSS